MVDYETAQRRRNIVVGVFVIAGLGAMGWMIFRFGDLPTVVSKINSFDIYAQFPTAPGVEKDTPVRFCGYQIGRVTQMMAPAIRGEIRQGRPTGPEYHQTVTVLSIDKKYSTIPSNVRVKLMTRGLGSSYIELQVDPDSLSAPPLDPNVPETCCLTDGMWLQGSTGMTSEFFPEESQKKLDLLLQDIRTFLGNANDVIGDPDNKENIKATLGNLADASKEITGAIERASVMLEEAQRTLDEFRQLASAGTTTLKSADAKAERLVSAMVVTSEELGKASAQLRMSLEKINTGQGTAGKLVNDARLYENLLESVDQLQVLMKHFQALIDKINEEGLRAIY